MVQENAAVKALILKLKFFLKFIAWVVIGYFGRPVSLDVAQKATVLITYFNPVRMKKINHQIRNLLKCTFVERIIISNHNPDVKIQEKITIENDRVTVINQPIRRGCGFRWFVAREFDPENLIVIDDDILLFPQQIASLFQCLLSEPEIPHGISGMNYLSNGGFDFRDKENANVDFLCEVYALTRNHLKCYMKISSSISEDKNIAAIVNSAADFVVLSHTGASKPSIHNVGRLLRDETFQMKGIAVHKDHSFEDDVIQVVTAIRGQGLSEHA